MKRVLICDDNSKVMEPLARPIREAGHSVKVIFGDEPGIQYYARNPVDVVIMGVVPPDLVGLKSIIRFKSEHPEVSIFAVEKGKTVERFDAYHPLKSARVFGAEQTFTTPREVNQLLTAIERLPNKIPRHLRRQVRQLGFLQRSDFQLNSTMET